MVGKHLDLAPGDATSAGAERLHDRLFGGEAGCQFARSAAAKGGFELRVHAPQEARPKLRQGAFDALNLDDVDADGAGVHRGDIV